MSLICSANNGFNYVPQKMKLTSIVRNQFVKVCM